MKVPWPLQPASYNGILFYVEANVRASGRRTVIKEVPKSDTLSMTEDMGRRIRKFNVTAYIIYSPVLDPNWEIHRSQLIAVCEADGTGVLKLPTMLSSDVVTVIVDTYTVTEHRAKGGYCEFQINFVEAGTAAASTATDTQVASNAAASQTTTDLTTSTDTQSTFATITPANGATPQGSFGGGDTSSTATNSAATTITPSANDVVSSDFGAFGQ